MNVCLLSAFRSAESYLDRYFEQIGRLRTLLTARGDRLDLVLGEGDHADETRLRLAYAAQAYIATLNPASVAETGVQVRVFRIDHGGPDHGSVVHAVRFANMAKVWNVLWAAIPEHANAVIFVEADLVWSPETLLTLLDKLADYPALAPMIHLQREGYPRGFFYDNWGFRRNGEQIATLPPYFPGWDGTQPIQIDSAGSCLVLRGDLARGLMWPPEDVVVGLCRQIYERGGSLYLDPHVSVTHL